jgi:pyruvate dehydrogenase E1 component
MPRPIFHAIQYLMGNQTREKMKSFRGFGGVQSYPSRTKDIDDVDFSTGSVGLGVAITSFASIVQDYIKAKEPWGGGSAAGAAWWRWWGTRSWTRATSTRRYRKAGRTTCANCWWIIDYNRQSLDGIVREGLFKRIEKIFDAFGWDVVTVKYGTCSARPSRTGRRKTARVDRQLPQPALRALTFMGGAVWRKRLMDDLGDQGDVTALIERRSDDELAALMENLGGNCVSTMADAFAASTTTGRPAFSPIRSRDGARRSLATRTITAG